MKTNNYDKRIIEALLQFSLILTVLISCFFCSCINREESEAVEDASRNLKNKTTGFIYNVIPADQNASITPEYSTAINTFSVNLLREVYKDPLFVNGNLVLSPFSVSRCLAIITDGATGKSKSELLEALGGQAALDDAQNALSELLYADNSVVLQCADAVWIDSSKFLLNQSFKQKANTKYGVECKGLNFSDTKKSAESINSWVSTNTNQCIKEVIDANSIHPLTVFFLTNAIYFKADWTSPFDITKTRSEPFYSPSGTVSADMMSSGYRHETRKTSVYENAKIYYGTSKKEFFYLDIYMPTTVSIEEFLQNSCLSALSSKDTFGIGALRMPKFSFKSNVDLKPMMKKLGIEEVFNQNNSDLSGIAQNARDSDSVQIYIEQIRHFAGIETDEEGTKAYASTVIAGIGTSGTNVPDVVLNKPFVYFIRAGKNGLILFAGVVNRPDRN